MTGDKMKCLDLYLRIRRDRIGYLRFILEGYDGLAQITTIDAGQGLVRLLFPGSRYAEVLSLLDGVAADINVQHYV